MRPALPLLALLLAACGGETVTTESCDLGDLLELRVEVATPDDRTGSLVARAVLLKDEPPVREWRISTGTPFVLRVEGDTMPSQPIPLEGGDFGTVNLGGTCRDRSRNGGTELFCEISSAGGLAGELTLGAPPCD